MLGPPRNDKTDNFVSVSSVDQGGGQINGSADDPGASGDVLPVLGKDLNSPEKRGGKRRQWRSHKGAEGIGLRSTDRRQTGKCRRALAISGYRAVAHLFRCCEFLDLITVMKLSLSAIASASPMLSMLGTRTRPSATAFVRTGARGPRRLPIFLSPRRSASLISCFNPIRRLRRTNHDHPCRS